MQNNHRNSIPKETIEQAIDLIRQASSLLSGYLVTLTPEERQTLPKMGEKTLSFVEKSGELAALNPEFSPFLNLEEFHIDLDDAVHLRPLANIIKQLQATVDDTITCAGSEAFTQALVHYAELGVAVRNKMPGAEQVFSELKKRYPRMPRKKQ